MKTFEKREELTRENFFNYGSVKRGDYYYGDGGLFEDSFQFVARWKKGEKKATILNGGSGTFPISELKEFTKITTITPQKKDKDLYKLITKFKEAKNEKIKFAINKCYGGFSLSDEALEYLPNDLNYYEEHRADPELILILEKLKEKASSSCSRIEVIEIDLEDCLDSYLINYDGMERIDTYQEYAELMINII